MHIHGHCQTAAGGSESLARLGHVPPDHELLVPVGTLILLQAQGESEVDTLADPEFCWGRDLEQGSLQVEGKSFSCLDMKGSYRLDGGNEHPQAEERHRDVVNQHEICHIHWLAVCHGLSCQRHADHVCTDMLAIIPTKQLTSCI